MTTAAATLKKTFLTNANDGVVNIYIYICIYTKRKRDAEDLFLLQLC